MTTDPYGKRGPGRPPAGGTTPSRSLRIGEVYDQAQRRAEERGEKVTHVIEQKLANYVAGDSLREHYETLMAEFRAVHQRREAWESSTGILASAATLPREILVPWRHALAHVRLLRAQYRRRGFEPPAAPVEMPWLDERVVEVKSGEESFFWVQTDAPKGSRFS